MINSTLLHPFLGRIAGMFRIIVLPHTVTIRIDLSDERQQIPLQDCLIANAFHASTKNAHLCRSSPGYSGPHMNLKK